MTSIDRYDQIVELLCGVGGYKDALTMRDIAKALGLKKTPYIETLVMMVVKDNECVHMDWRVNAKNREARYFWGLDQREMTASEEQAIVWEYDHWYKMTFRQPPAQNKPREDWQVGE